MEATPYETRIAIAGLDLKMYVSRLDRPWIESPFLLEGLLVETQEDLEKLQKLCRHVYIDVTRGASPDRRYVEPEEPVAAEKSVPFAAEFAALNTTTWQIATRVEVELPVAAKAQHHLERGIEQMMTDLHDGRELDLLSVREGVGAMIDSVTRNPSAFTWLKAIRKKSSYTYQHALGSSVWAASFGRHLGLNRQEIDDLAFAGLMFDVGKASLSVELLDKTGSYDDEDWRQMRAHVQAGVEILERTPGVSQRTIQAVATHHERHDGSGYPRGLRGAQIPIFGRLIGLIDSYDAMTSARPYAPGRTAHQAVMELYNVRDILFQSDLVEQFIQTCGVYPPGSLVELSDGRVGVVTAVHDLKRLRPNVMLLLDAIKQPLPEFVAVDLSQVANDDKGKPLTIRRGLPERAFGIDPAELFIN
ncbi:MAG TPA: HD-GYP domain-containing protein [Xanthomonadaceae bacterium]|jgi:HD-GYP domain-containing protein (c-di-GMP phosphodiesterase class II)